MEVAGHERVGSSSVVQTKHARVSKKEVVGLMGVERVASKAA